MRRVALMSAAALFVVACRPAYAQDPPPPLPRVVVDLHGIVPVFPNDSQQLADSRGLDTITELPGAGFGARAGLHLYLLKWKVVTLGIGGEVFAGRSSNTPAPGATVTLGDGSTVPAVGVGERLSLADGQVSFNFGSGQGWSYISGGVGRAQWSIVPDAAAPTAADSATLPTTNYGGGARWFVKSHVAFSLDVRVYEIQPGASLAGRRGSPRTRLFVIGAGVSLK